MVEQVFRMYQGNDKTIEKVLLDENIHYLHMILNQNESLPTHLTNGNVYMTVISGILNIALADNEAKEYEKGTLLKIPSQIKMSVNNFYKEKLELIVVKAPAPKI